MKEETFKVRAGRYAIKKLSESFILIYLLGWDEFGEPFYELLFFEVYFSFSAFY